MYVEEIQPTCKCPHLCLASLKVASLTRGGHDWTEDQALGVAIARHCGDSRSLEATFDAAVSEMERARR